MSSEGEQVRRYICLVNYTIANVEWQQELWKGEFHSFSSRPSWEVKVLLLIQLEEEVNIYHLPEVLWVNIAWPGCGAWKLLLCRSWVCTCKSVSILCHWNTETSQRIQILKACYSWRCSKSLFLSAARFKKHFYMSLKFHYGFSSVISVLVSG